MKLAPLAGSASCLRLRPGERLTDSDALLPPANLWGRVRVHPTQSLAALRLLSLGVQPASVRRITGLAAATIRKVAATPDEERGRLLAISGRDNWVALIAELAGSVLFWSATHCAWNVRYPTFVNDHGKLAFSIASKCPACGRGVADASTRQSCRRCGVALRAAPCKTVSRAMGRLHAGHPPGKADLDLIVMVMEVLRHLVGQDELQLAGVRNGETCFANQKWAGDRATIEQKAAMDRRAERERVRMRRARRKMAKASQKRNSRRGR